MFFDLPAFYAFTNNGKDEIGGGAAAAADDDVECSVAMDGGSVKDVRCEDNYVYLGRGNSAAYLFASISAPGVIELMCEVYVDGKSCGVALAEFCCVTKCSNGVLCCNAST